MQRLGYGRFQYAGADVSFVLSSSQSAISQLGAPEPARDNRIGSKHCQDLAFPNAVRIASVFLVYELVPTMGSGGIQFLCGKHVVFINDRIGGTQVNSQQKACSETDGENGQGQMHGGTIDHFDFTFRH